MTATPGTFGVRSMTAPLRSVALRTPTTVGDFDAAGWRPPDPALLLDQHERLAELLSGLGAEVVVLPPLDGMVDACFVFDPLLVTGAGAVVLRSAKAIRFAEAEPLVAELERCDLPHDRGPGHVLHLLSVVSPVAGELAVVFEPLAPVSLLEELRERMIRWVPVDPEEYATLGANVLAVRPGVVVMADGNPRTRRALEAEGCEVHVYQASELSKGDGGPTCLTRPLRRSP